MLYYICIPTYIPTYIHTYYYTILICYTIGAARALPVPRRPGARIVNILSVIHLL